jgi:hypothetical protein
MITDQIQQDRLLPHLPDTMSPQVYRYGPVAIASALDLPLPQLPPAAADMPRFSLWVSAAPPAGKDSVTWFPSAPVDDEPEFLRLGHQSGRYWLDFPDLADFVVQPDERTITAFPAANLPEHTLIHLLLDQVMPRVLSLTGLVVLHASAVLVEEQVIFFVGQSGQGKSTLAAGLARQGYTVLTDDVLIVRQQAGRCEAITSYPALRLWPDSAGQLMTGATTQARVAHYSNKQRFATGQVASDWLPVAHGYVLGQPADEVTLTHLGPRAAVIALLEASFRLDVANHALLQAEFDLLTWLARILPLERLDYPRDYTRLPEVAQSIIQHTTIPK